MGKKLVFDYTFDASAGTITVNDIYAQKRWQLISNLTDNVVIYQFNDPAFGFSDVSFDYDNSTTTVTLAYDTSSMSDTDSLQIFVDEGSTDVTVNDRFVDPVSKIRVSNPENLIDTDFEYGLQSTKWETLELTANIPTFFSRSGDFSLTITSMDVKATDDSVTVVTSESHGFQRGSPIIVQGSGNVAADGGFVVASVVDANTFIYKAKSTFTVGQSIKDTFTQIFPGSIYSGTEFKLSNVGGIVTDSADPSVLTVTTEYPTDFETGTSMALANTFAKATINFSTDDVTAGAYISNAQTRAANLATGETDDFLLGGVSVFNAVPRDAYFFREGTSDLTIDTVNNRIIFPSPHGLSSYDSIVYLCDTNTNTPIGGIDPHYQYFVYYINSTTIELRTYRTSSTGYRPNLTSSGTNNGVTRSAFAFGNHAYRFYNRYQHFWFYNNVYYSYNKWGYPYSTRTRAFQYRSRYYGYAGLVTDTDSIYSLNVNGGTSADYWLQGYAYTNAARAYYDQTGSGYITHWSRYYYDDWFWFRFLDSNRRSSIYLPNHGFTGGETVEFTSTSTPPGGMTAGLGYSVSYVDDNRIGFDNIESGSEIYFTHGGSSTNTYGVNQVSGTKYRDTLHLPGTSLNDGDAVQYDANGGTVIPGLVDGTTYYVANKVDDRIMFANTENYIGTAHTFFGRSSSYVNYTLDYIYFTANHNMSDGDAVIYNTTSVVKGLENGAVYYISVYDTRRVQLHYTRADAIAGTNIVPILFYSPSNVAQTLTEIDIVDITGPVPSGETQILVADFVGAADGNYTIASNAADQLSFTFNASNQVTARSITATAQDSFVASLNAFRIEDHGLITGDSVTYTETGSTNVSGLTSGTVYYVIVRNKDFISLATTEDNAENNIDISLTETGASSTPLTGTVSFAPVTIIGRFNGSGIVSFVGGSKTVTGDGTAFTSYFNKGDQFVINQAPTTLTTSITGWNTVTEEFTAVAHGLTTGDVIYFTGTTLPTGFDADKLYFAAVTGVDTFTVHYTATDAAAASNKIVLNGVGSSASVNGMTDTGTLVERTIDYVNGDGQLTVVEDLPADDASNVNYLQRTSLLLRPDGFALHRPYDGGVELIPPTNPDSQMIRQTRKYFRYQSGKGIQVSFAVNFSPTSQIDTFSRNGSVGTIVTRFPHRLSDQLNITISGSTNREDTIGTKTFEVAVYPDANGDNKFVIDGEQQASLTLYEGRTYRFDMSDSTTSGHPLRFSTTDDGTHATPPGTAYVTGVTDNYATNAPGTAGSYIEITVASAAPDLFYYCENHSGMGGSISTPVDTGNNQKNLWNGTFQIASVVDDYTVTVNLEGTPSDATAQGVVEYYVNNWQNSSLRCGLFDDQNGIFFEYDGQDLYCCRRSSIRQLSGYATVEFRSGHIIGNATKFNSQVRVGDMIVIKGQSHKVTRVDGDTSMYVAPSYRGANASKVVITKTETTRVRQDNWSLDTCDGTGYTGFKLDIHKIQMAYVDYSWYGAGKVRFGFKDQHGNVRYVHSFVHGNFFTEAYMRSGNVPARYEIENIGTPTYVPALAHWGTSVIMDGRFDPDKAYLFNASSNNLSVTGVSSTTTNARASNEFPYIYRVSNNYRPILGYALELQSPNNVLNSFAAGTVITGANIPAGTKLANPLSTDIKPYQPYLPSVRTYEAYNDAGNFFYQSLATRNLLVIDQKPTGETNSYSSYTIGSGDALNVTKELPLISVRLAPSVDTSAPGFLGEREIINRMQLILNQVSVLSTHACTVRLVLNGQLSSNAWQRVTNPSLSQLIIHENTDTINGGLSVYNFEASGGTGTSARTPVLTTEALGDIATLGNAILGGDNVYPDGPDVLTVVVQLNEDPSTVSTSNPFTASGRISWSESQA